MTCCIFISFINQLKHLLFLSVFYVWRPLHIIGTQIAYNSYTYECKYEYFRGKQMFGWKSWFNFSQELHISEF